MGNKNTTIHVEPDISYSKETKLCLYDIKKFLKLCCWRHDMWLHLMAPKAPDTTGHCIISNSVGHEAILYIRTP